VDYAVPIRYFGGMDPAYRYYYGPDYAYDDFWYQQRHLSYPDLYEPFGYEPFGECPTYYYGYQGSYWCYRGT
jgi:hypothetical protein